MLTPPQIPKSEKKEDLGFERKPMVRWFDPGQLAGTGIQALLSSIFGAFADKRETQAALHKSQIRDYTEQDEIWIDYIADLGDGWNPTYTMAKLLVRDELEFDGLDESTKRGQLLIMGGDQVYPTATREEYRNRLVGPYQSALPWVPEDKHPHLFVVPGNHDWYDGLTSFTRLFCQGRWIGGWQTKQSRSYFALKLPHNWWLWGIDVQLASDIDRPQRDYFIEVAKKMREGDRIILCTPEPTWVYSETDGPEAYDNLKFFENNIIRKHGGILAVTLAGDLHHYCRYEAPNPDAELLFSFGLESEVDLAVSPLSANLRQQFIKNESSVSENATVEGNSPLWRITDVNQMTYTVRKEENQLNTYDGEKRQRITAGGGGAFLYGTGDMPKTLELDEGKADDKAEPKPVKYVQAEKATFPDKSTSRGLSWGVLLFPRRNLRVSLLIGGLYLLFTWLLQSASRGGDDTTFMKEISELDGLWNMLEAFFSTIAYSPTNVVFVFGLIGGLYAFCAAKSWYGRLLLGGGHAILHLLLNLLLIWCFSVLNPHLLGVPIGTVGNFVLVIIEMFIFGSLLGGSLMGIYLLIANLIGRFTPGGIHTNELFSSMRIEDYKSFLRLRINKDGLTIYPIGVTKVCKKWKFNPNAEKSQSWFEPEKGPKPKPKLLENPIEIKTT